MKTIMVNKKCGAWCSNITNVNHDRLFVVISNALNGSTAGP